MADSVTTENSAGLQTGSSVQNRNGSSPRIWSIPGFFLLGARRISIDKILINGELFVPKNSISLKTADVVTFIGENLGIFNNASFLNDSSGGILKTVLKDSDSADSILSFTVPDLSASVGKDAFFWLRLNSQVVPQASRVIAPYLVYTQETAEEQEKRKRQAGEKAEQLEQNQNVQQGGPSGLVLNSMGDLIDGVVGTGNRQARSSSGSAKGPSNSAQPSFLSSQKQGLIQDADEAEEVLSATDLELQENKVLSSTAEVSTGGQVISQGSTTVSSGTQNISSGGTVSGRQTVSAGSATTVEQSGSIASGQTGLGGGVGQAAVRSTTEISQTQNVSGGAGQAQVNDEVKINATGSQTTQSQPPSASSPINANVTENLQASAKVEGSQEASVSSDQKSSANVAGQGPQSQPQSSGTNITGEQQLNLNSSTESSKPNLNNKISESGTSGIPSTLKPPAGLGAMKSREVNLNQTLGRPIVGSTGISPKQNLEPEKTTAKIGSSINPEVRIEGEVPAKGMSISGIDSAVVPNEAQQEKEIGKDVGELPKLVTSEEVKFQKKPGAESKGRPILSGAPIGSLNLKPEPKVGEVNQESGKAPRSNEPGRENFRMPELQESNEGGGSSIPGSGTESQAEPATEKEPNLAEDQEQQEENGNEEEPESGGGIGDAIQGAQEGAKLGENFGPEGAAIGAAIGAAVNTQAGQEVIGQATGKLWWWGFGFSSATFFIGLDFLVGAVIMNIYWYSHRKQPKIFPMKAWQKFMTVFASVFPFFAIIFLLSLLMAVGCNYPTNKLGYKFTVIGAFIGEDCKYFDVSEQIKSTTPNSFPGNTQTPTTNPPTTQPGVNPRGTSP